MIKIKRKINPNLKGEEFIDGHFINLLTNALLTSSLGLGNKYIASALIYKNIGHSKCEDCSDELTDVYYDECKCEWCEDCHFNYCTCKLDTFEKLHDYIVHLIIKYLNKKQRNKILDLMIKTNDNHKFDEQIKKLNIFNTRIK